jgi:hypothetical protein
MLAMVIAIVLPMAALENSLNQIPTGSFEVIPEYYATSQSMTSGLDGMATMAVNDLMDSLLFSSGIPAEILGSKNDFKLNARIASYVIVPKKIHVDVVKI